MDSLNDGHKGETLCSCEVPFAVDISLLLRPRIDNTNIFRTGRFAENVRNRKQSVKSN